MKQTKNGVFILVFMIAFIIVSLVPACSGAIFLNNGTEIMAGSLIDTIKNCPPAQSGNPFPVQFFYSSNCGSCKDAREFLQSFERKNPDIPIEYHNLVQNGENRGLFTEYKKRFHSLEISYPVIFIGNIGITGSSDIIHMTDQVVKGYLKIKD